MSEKERRTFVREAWKMSDGRIDYFAPVPPSRRSQAAGRSGAYLYRCRVYFWGGRAVEVDGTREAQS